MRMSPDVTIRSLDASRDADRCDEIISTLPYHFGDPDGIVACAVAVRSERGWVAEREGTVVAFGTIYRHPFGTAEISWFAVHADHRRTGIGHDLADAIAAQLGDEGVNDLLVLTLGPSVPDADDVLDGYDTTRRFWQDAGFVPLRELQLSDWNDSHALLLVRRLTAGD